MIMVSSYEGGGQSEVIHPIPIYTPDTNKEKVLVVLNL
jgi:hypothetical protein